MKVKIDDTQITRIVELQINNDLQKKVSEIVKGFDAKKMASELFNSSFTRESKRILGDGRFYDVLSKHLAKECVNLIIDKIDIDKVNEGVAKEIAKTLMSNLKNIKED